VVTGRAPRPYQTCFRAMGSPCELRLYAGSREEAERVADAAVEEVARLESKYSRYRESSLASRINRSAGDAAGVEVDPETARLLDYAATCWAESGGLFDITSGVLRRVWKLDSGRVPSQREIEAILPCVGWQRVRWRSPRLSLPREGMELDFGGFVKEYAVDRVTALCRRLGVRHGLVDLGGDLGVVGPHPDGAPWRVGVRDPRRPERAIAVVALARGALASSGDYERCMAVDGRRYGHVLDPRSGWPVEGLAAVSVVAPHCLVAGTASTVGMLKGRREGPRWLDALGLPSLRVSAEGEVSGTLGRASDAARAAAAVGRGARVRAA
jgi:FAD:protein FMN transferase